MGVVLRVVVCRPFALSEIESAYTRVNFFSLKLKRLQKLSLSVYSKSTYDSLVWLGFFDLSKLLKKHRTAGHLVF